MQPFERIKVMLQTQGPVKEHKGILDCIQKVMKQEGIAGFYKGTLVPLMGIGLIGSVRFGVFEMIKRHMHQDLNIRDAQWQPSLGVQYFGCILYWNDELFADCKSLNPRSVRSSICVFASKSKEHQQKRFIVVR
jgi:hypothetical protein